MSRLITVVPKPGRRIRLAIVSTYPPRRCGLATFAKDLRDALVEVAPDIAVSVCAMDVDGYGYPAEVTAVVAPDDPAAYQAAAHRLYRQGVDAVIVQHEYGIFGGPDGAHVLALSRELRELGVPYLVTPHTVLSSPSPGQVAVLAELCRGAALVSVLTPTAVRFAVQAGLVHPDRVVVTPHGAPAALRDRTADGPVRPRLAEALASVAGHPLLSTFGLIGPGKAIETAIDALAKVAAAHPDVRYIVAGATHPHQLRASGEAYRDELLRRVAAHGLAGHVAFVNDYLTTADLAALLARTDIYLTPYGSREQISSGTLTFAVAAGCPAVSTDYHYARDMLSGGAGVLVPVDDPNALGDALNGLLDDPAALAAARATAGGLGAGLLWPAVARRVATLVRTVAADGRDPAGPIGSPAAPMRHSPARSPVAGRLAR